MKRLKKWKTRKTFRKWLITDPLLLRSRWQAEAAMTGSLIMSIRSCAKHDFVVTSMSCQCTHAPTHNGARPNASTNGARAVNLVVADYATVTLPGWECVICFFRNYFFLDIHLL